jgi:flagellar biosynthesis protein FlhA
MKTDKLIKNQEGHNIAIAAGVTVLILLMVILMPAVILNILMAVNWLLVLAVFLAALFTGRQCGTKVDEGEIISGKTDVFSRFPAVFLSCAIFGLALYVSFIRLILTQGTEAGNRIVLFVSGLVNRGGTAGIIAGFVSILVVCVAVILAAQKGSARTAEAARFVLDLMPETMTAIERAYACGEISGETFVTRKDNIAHQADFLGAMDGVGKFVAGNAKVMIFIITAGILGSIIIGTGIYGQTIQEAAETSIAFVISGGIIFLLPLLLLLIAISIVSSRGYEFSVRQLTDAKGAEKPNS